MNDKTAKVFNGWLALTVEERQKFNEALREYTEKPESGKAEFRESVRKSATRMETGPLGKGCPCCGR